MKTCLIIAGEQSGEEHALSFFADVKKRLPDFSFFGVGGEGLKQEGLECLYSLNEFSSWGFNDVFKKLFFYQKSLTAILKTVDEKACKVALLIDFQSYNLLLAKRLKKRGVKVLYYVAPQAWAWKSWRVHSLKKCVDKLFCLFPFEKSWFSQRGVKNLLQIEHPLLRAFKHLPTEKKASSSKELTLLLLPGSRNAEVRELLPIFLESVEKLRQNSNISVRLILVQASSVRQDFYDYYRPFVDRIFSHSEREEAFIQADLCLAASGTVTLATGLFLIPTIVCYKVSLLEAFFYEAFVNYRGYFSLTNLILGEEVFPELLQDQVKASKIATKLEEWIQSPKSQLDIHNKLKQLKSLLQGDDFNTGEFLAAQIVSSYEAV